MCLRASPETGHFVSFDKVLSFVICEMPFGKDPRTYDMAARILKEEIEHEACSPPIVGGKKVGEICVAERTTATKRCRPKKLLIITT